MTEFLLRAWRCIHNLEQSRSPAHNILTEKDGLFLCLLIFLHTRAHVYMHTHTPYHYAFGKTSGQLVSKAVTLNITFDAGLPHFRKFTLRKLP